eukprot:scaffold988_cov165-Ochromonas_danica.AAC.26
MQVKFSPMVEKMSLSKTIEIFGKTKEMEKAGKPVFSLCVGEPDYQPPQEVLQAVCEAAAKGVTKYTSVNGDFSLRQAIGQDLLRRKGLHYSPEEIVISNGAKQAVIQTLMAVASPGDKVIIPAPYWTSYPDMVKMCGAVPVTLKTSAKDRYALLPEQLEACLAKEGDQVGAIILCNPSNPTGCLMTEAQQQSIGKVLEKYPKVVVISDEIYERLVYDNLAHVSFAKANPTLADRTVTINGFSKSHAMTGFRLGYSASSLAVAKQINKIQSQLTSCASSIAQYAITKVLGDERVNKEIDEKWMKNAVLTLQKKRDFVAEGLLAIPHVHVAQSQGAFYLFPEVSAYYGKRYKGVDGEEKVIANSHDLCLTLLAAEGVALVPGEAFGDEACVRISYATSQDILEEAVKRMQRFFSALY